MQRKELNDKLNKARVSWKYIWDLIEQVLKEYPGYELKFLLYKYQVELDSNLRKMEYIEQRINDEILQLDKEEYHSVEQLLSWISTDHIAKTIFIDNILKKRRQNE